MMSTKSTDSGPRCPRCGQPLGTSSVAGLCPRCLMAGAMQPTQSDEELAPMPPLSPAELAPHFPQLEILECLGRGGMGVVYKARQKSLQRLVALKLLAPERAGDPRFAHRFEREARALASLNHPNIVAIHDFGQAGGFFYLLMEFVDGPNLRQLLRAKRLSPAEALGIVPSICHALQCAHDRGIVHRDIKPENLLMDRSGAVKIADFGIATMIDPNGHQGGGDVAIVGASGVTQAGAGTPDYAAPEQARGSADHRADIYSLGVVLYEMLTGELPGPRLEPPSRKVQMDVRIDEVVLRALEQRPELRFQTASEMRTRVETLATNSTPMASESGTGAPIEPPVESSPSPRILKTSNGYFDTPERLSKLAGQLFHYRGRAQLVLDERRLTLSRKGELISIPLDAITNLSVGEYPRAVNPAGLDHLDLTYVADGQSHRILFSPSDRLFELPSAWNLRVAEWQVAIRSAVQAMGRPPPVETPRSQLPKIPSAKAFGAIIAAQMLVLVIAALVLVWAPPTGSRLDITRLVPVLIPLVMISVAWLVRLGNRKLALTAVAGGLLVVGAGITAMILTLPKPGTEIRSVTLEPVGVINNVLIVEVGTSIDRWAAELRAQLLGPHLSVEEEEVAEPAVADGLPHLRIKPMPAHGNMESRILPAGTNRTRLAFVLPNAALALQAYGALQSFAPDQGPTGKGQFAPLFKVRTDQGVEYAAKVRVAPPLHSGNPAWMEVQGRSSHSNTSLQFTWSIYAVREGVVRLGKSSDVGGFIAGRPPSSRLRKNLRVPTRPDSPPGAEVKLELTRVGVARTRVKLTVAGMGESEIVEGRFEVLAEELMRTGRLSLTAVRPEPIELFRLGGESWILRIMALESER